MGDHDFVVALVFATNDVILTYQEVDHERS